MKRVLPTPLNILSLGVGVQSTTLYYMSALGKIPRFDYAIFADPGREKQKTYEYLKKLMIWGKKHNGSPIIICKNLNLYNDLINGTNSSGNVFASIPAFTSGTKGRYSIIKRQCTQEYKIRVVNKAIRKLYNLANRKWTPPTRISIGITTDESERMKFTQKKWQTYVYYFCGYEVTQSDFKKIDNPSPFSRQDCINWLIKHGFDVPVSSSCNFCPYQSDQSWSDLKNNEPDEFKSIVLLDKSIRKNSIKGVNQPIYLHNSLKPLDKVHFKNRSTDLFSQCNSGFCNT